MLGDLRAAEAVRNHRDVHTGLEVRRKAAVVVAVQGEFHKSAAVPRTVLVEGSLAVRTAAAVAVALVEEDTIQAAHKAAAEADTVLGEGGSQAVGHSLAVGDNLPAEEGTRPAVHNVLDPEEALEVADTTSCSMIAYLECTCKIKLHDAVFWQVSSTKQSKSLCAFSKVRFLKYR